MLSKALRRPFPGVLVAVLFLSLEIPSNLLFGQNGLSHVRVVRLSYVSGTVGVRRPASSEWAKAQVNTPIQEGFDLLTSANSYAEVEFENGSTARLGEFTKLNFNQLAMDEEGGKLNRITFEKGYATFHFLPEHHDLYSVKVGQSTLTPNGKSEFRTDLEHGRGRVEVFNGSVEVASSGKTTKVGKDKVLEFDPEATEVALVAKQGIVKDDWDKWTSERDNQAQLSVSDQAVAGPGSMYGWSDLGAYGEWGFFPGFGFGWSPFVSAGWSPYSMGMWSWYPGMGYTWIAGEPWGWLPYHYGSWNFSPGFGYFWMPGNMNYYSPALVSWYSGPGWIGWAPLGAIGAPGQALITTVPGSVIQNGMMVNSASASRVPLGEGVRIKQLPFQPGAGAILSGPRLSTSGEASFAASHEANHIMAPTSILMGGDGQREQALLGGHQPLRVVSGATLGGAYAVHVHTGEIRGAAFLSDHGGRARNAPEFSRGGFGGPTLLQHGQQQSYNSPHPNGGMAPSAGGGSIPASSAPSASSVASSPSMGHAGPSGGGHH